MDENDLNGDHIQNEDIKDERTKQFLAYYQIKNPNYENNEANELNYNLEK